MSICVSVLLFPCLMSSFLTYFHVLLFIYVCLCLSFSLSVSLVLSLAFMPFNLLLSFFLCFLFLTFCLLVIRCLSKSVSVCLSFCGRVPCAAETGLSGQRCSSGGSRRSGSCHDQISTVTRTSVTAATKKK